MNSRLTGRAWTFGDNVDTDLLAPGPYLKLPVEEAARHCLEAVNPEFARRVEPGDFVVAGSNFGLGSSREQAAQMLSLLGVGAVLAGSFARIFYRNAINLGLPALFFPHASEITAGDRLEVDLLEGEVRNLTSQKTYRAEPIPGHLLQIIRDGGLMPHLKKKLSGANRA